MVLAYRVTGRTMAYSHGPKKSLTGRATASVMLLVIAPHSLAAPQQNLTPLVPFALGTATR
jgi:hypothetical protein